jgi:hypothetical protein
VSELSSALGIASEEEFLKSLGMSIEQAVAGGDDNETVQAAGCEDKETVGGGRDMPAASWPQATAKGAEENAAGKEMKVGKEMRVSRKGIGDRHEFSKVSFIVVVYTKYIRSLTF